MSIDITEVAAIEFTPWEPAAPMPFDFDGIAFAARLAETIMARSKSDLVAGFRGGGPTVAADALACFDALDNQLAGLNALVDAARARIMIGMGVVAQS